MVADAKSCKCATCGVVCTGRFSGCAAVWAAGPRKVNAMRGSLVQRRVTPAPIEVEAAPEAPSAPADDAQVDALRADLISVMRRLDEVQVDAVRADLASVAQRLEALTSAVAAQRQELQRLAQRPGPSPPVRPAEQPAPRPPARPAEQPAPRPPKADRGPQPQPQPRRPEPARPNGGPSGPARPTPVPPAPAAPPAPAVAPVVPAPGEPEQIDLAVPLDQAILRPAGPDPRQG